MSAPAAPPDATFDAIGNDALSAGKAPGFSFVIVHGGDVVYARGFGMADLGLKRAIRVEPQTRFAIGSITKQFTAASILLLAQRGKLALDDTVAKYDPTYPNATRITLRMLLNQTAGLHNYPIPFEHDWPWAGPVALHTLLAILATDKPDFEPGTQWEYSNANYALLSGILGAAAGVDEATFLQRNIFGPLQMTASGYGNAAQRDGVAVAYAGTPTPNGTPTFTVQSPVGLDLYAGAGAIVSSGPDLAKWDLALMHGTLLDAAATHALWSAGTLSNGAPVNYAMGFVPATLAGHREVWHNGLAPGAGGYCYNAIFPDDGLAVIVLSNGYDFRGVPERMVERVLAAYDPKAAALLAPPKIPSPAPGEDPAVTARAKDWYHRLRTGTIDLTQATPAFAERLTPALLQQIQQGMVGTPEPTDWIYLGARSANGITISSYWIRIDGVVHTWSIGLTPDGKVALSGLQ